MYEFIVWNKNKHKIPVIRLCETSPSTKKTSIYYHLDNRPPLHDYLWRVLLFRTKIYFLSPPLYKSHTKNEISRFLIRFLWASFENPCKFYLILVENIRIEIKKSIFIVFVNFVWNKNKYKYLLYV
jgi:hypothetical protein